MTIIIKYDGDTWRLLGEGACRDGKVYCQLASTTRGRMQRNGWNPLQICDWIDQQVILSAAIQGEEAQRAGEDHKGPCVQWRGRGGDIGSCIYCGKKPDAITAYYSDRAISGMATLTATR